jgi:hypothetical protein
MDSMEQPPAADGNTGVAPPTALNGEYTIELGGSYFKQEKIMPLSKYFGENFAA